MNLFLKLENGNWKFKRKEHKLGGIQYIFSFENGFQASVIKNEYSYGSDRDLWELAVLKDKGLHYDNPVANGDVRGYLTDEEVNKLLRQIEQFKKEG